MLSRCYQVHRVCSQVHSQACSQGRSHSHSMAHSQPAWLYTSKPVLKLSNTLLSTLSSTLPIALDDTLPACLNVRSQVSSQDASKYTEYVLKYTPGHAPKDAHTCTRWHTASLLDYILPNQRSRSSQAHSRASSQVHFQLHSMVHSQPTWLYAPKHTLKREDTPNLTWLYAHMYPPACSIQRLAELQKPATRRHQLQVPGSRRHQLPAPGTGSREADGVWWAVFGLRHVACGVLEMAGGVWWPNHDIGRYHSLNLVLAKASTDLEPSISQFFHKLRVFHRPKASCGKLYSSRICSCMLDPETWWVADARHHEAWSRWPVACGRWRVVGGGRPKSWRQSIS